MPTEDDGVVMVNATALRQLLTIRAEVLSDLALYTDGYEGVRIEGKSQGVRLALSYLDDAIRERKNR